MGSQELSLLVGMQNGTVTSGDSLAVSYKIKVFNFPGGSVVRNLPASVEDMDSIPGPGRFHMTRGS